MKFRPLHDRVLIEVLDSEEKTAGGIIIPEIRQNGVFFICLKLIIYYHERKTN